jgi:hypothetical protein
MARVPGERNGLVVRTLDLDRVETASAHQLIEATRVLGKPPTSAAVPLADTYE